MTREEKLSYVVSLASQLLQDTKVEVSPIFTPYRMGSCVSEMAFGLDGQKSLFDLGWRFQWNRGKRRIGCCSYKDKTIELSYLYVENTEDPELFRNTILHEIAHALTPGHNHDNIWKKACLNVGADPSRLCNDDRIVGANKHLAGWVAKCGCCAKEHVRHRRPKYMNGLICINTNKCQVMKLPLKWEQK